MRIIYFKEQEAMFNGQCVATIGMFDGVHRGHRFVIDCLRQEAERCGLPSCVITFDRHPKETVPSALQRSPYLLTTLNEKLALLSQTGIDLCVVLPFTKELSQLSARDFMQLVLKEQLGVRVLLTGYDNHFGHRNPEHPEGFEDYRRYGQELDIEVKGQPAAPSTLHLPPSSSLIRRLLQEGRMEEANEVLGYPYSLTGMVVSGEHIGTHIGFPTANLQPDNPHKLIPANGAYAVRVRIGDAKEQLPGMTNIGQRPTFDGKTTTLETHILHYDGTLYGQSLTVSFIHRLRDEQRFDTPEALAAQLRRDAATAEEKLVNK